MIASLTTTDPFARFGEIWSVDFEFRAPDGERPEPLCVVAREYRSGRLIRLWKDEMSTAAPFSVDSSTLFVAYYASAELGCFLSLGWSQPVNVLDLFAEFRNRTNGLPTPCGSGLLGALAYFGLDGLDSSEKESMRTLAMRGGEYTESERKDLLDYCQSDVDALDKLLPLMAPSIDLPRALLRGRYMAAAANMEWNGIPIDVEHLDRLKRHWLDVQAELVKEIDQDYGVFIPTGFDNISSAIREEAEAAGIDAFDLLDAVRWLHEQERAETSDRTAAVNAAREETGLTTNRIRKWEDAGKDAASWEGLDVKARSLAAEQPALGIGAGYDNDAGYDDADYAGELWNLLSEPTPKARSKSDRSLIADAAELVRERKAPTSTTRRMSFSTDRFAQYLIRSDIPWPRLPTGSLAMDDQTFREMARSHPQVAPLRELRHALGELRLFDLAVGSDGRNRCLLSAFRARTGRNQPSNSRFVFGPSVWIRGLIQPAPGMAIAYVDWSQQEVAIAAALSRDKAMMDAYESGDCYLTFAKQAGAAPANATKESHGAIRDQFKACVLATQYGMGSTSLAARIGQSEAHARELLRLHRQTYPRFWEWSEAVVNHAMLYGWIQTVFGWRISVGHDANPRSLSNFPMQANGAEMLRLACCLATEAGVTVCAPVHDAILVEGSTDDIEDVVIETQKHMLEASKIVLNGFTIRTDAKIVKHPDRYMDPRGEKFWSTVAKVVDERSKKLGHFRPPVGPLPPTGWASLADPFCLI